MKLLVNFAAFQVGWFGCVLAGAGQLPWAGTLLAAALVAMHASLAARPGHELALAACAALIGALWDSVLTATGVLVFPSGQLLPGTAPHWIVAIWALFATTLNVSLRWLRGRPWLAAALGAGAGPLAYYAGHRLGGVEFSDPVAALLVLGIGWALLMPALIELAVRLDGSTPAPRLEYA